MAFNKYANAHVVRPVVDMAGWIDTRRKGTVVGRSHNAREARVVLDKYDPKEYLLSHCTIIASVDTQDVKVPLGTQLVDNFQINRRYADYYVKPETLKYINNNNDCWERKLLLSAFRTFTGGENYVEHIQIPELSKGKIIDAAARDIGDSLYVDILVATNRKHKPLIDAITAGSLSTLSMGCQVTFTVCTKCGNVAYDETQLCPHIKYLKGNDFFDEFGTKRKIAELCGHVKEEPGSVKFIEASWVANPAFKGAVLRNILSPKDVANLGGKMMAAFSQPVRVADSNSMQRAARTLRAQFGQDPTTDTQAPKDDKKDNDPIKKVVDDLASTVREKVIEKVRGEIGEDEAARLNTENSDNETLIKTASKDPAWRKIAKEVLTTARDVKLARKIFLGLVLYKHNGWSALVKTGSFSGRELLAVARMLDLMTKRSIKAGESRVYRTILRVGGMARFEDIESYLSACRRVVGRDLSSDEVSSLIDKGRLFDLGS